MSQSSLGTVPQMVKWRLISNMFFLYRKQGKLDWDSKSGESTVQQSNPCQPTHLLYEQTEESNNSIKRNEYSIWEMTNTRTKLLNNLKPVPFWRMYTVCWHFWYRYTWKICKQTDLQKEKITYNSVNHVYFNS